MVLSPPFVAIPSFSRHAHWLSCYAHGGFSCPWMWRSGEVDHMEQIKKEATAPSVKEASVASFGCYLKTGWQMRVNGCVAASRANWFLMKSNYK